MRIQFVGVEEEYATPYTSLDHSSNTQVLRSYYLAVVASRLADRNRVRFVLGFV
jgi:hypothetical protein